MLTVHFAVLALTRLLISTTLGYVLLAAWRAHQTKAPQKAGCVFAPPVSILKPLCGDEPNLYENLRSFFVLDYPNYQIVFGVRDSADPALQVVRRLQEEFPGRDVKLVIDPHTHGMNGKSSNLINMLQCASSNVFVIADSDIKVPNNYLVRVVSHLALPDVGAVTCPYSAYPALPTFASRLACMQINDWFLPSILVARAVRRVDFCMGSTIAIRREALAAIGGFWALRDVLADDYFLGRALVDHGYRIVLSECHVQTVVAEAGFSDVLRHELRWARTIRTVRPLGFAGMFLTNTFSMCVLSGLMLIIMGQGLAPGIATVVVGALARLSLHREVKNRFGAPRISGWLLPVRDFMSLGVWVASFFSREVTWRGKTLSVDHHGMLLSEAD